MTFAHSTGLRHPALLRQSSSGFEDPFADATLAQFEQFQNGDGGLTVDQNHKLLSFSSPYHNLRLYNDSYHGTSVDITAQLQGNFYLGEPQWSGTPDTPPPPPELTCYRRNLFSIDGHVKVPRNLRYVWTDDGNRIPLMDLELAVSAIESVEGNPTKLISVPFKGPPAGENPPKAEDKTEKEPSSILLDPTSSTDLDGDYTTLPFHWKRLQFRSATQNNGRRKELQQHFVLKLKVIAVLVTGVKQVITECQSGPIIVRGRSPRNFASRNDIPLTTGSASRRHVPTIPRHSTSHPSSMPRVTSAPRLVSSPPDEVSQTVPQFPNNELPNPTQDFLSQGPLLTPEAVPTPGYLNALNQPSLTFPAESSPEFPQGTPFTFSPGIPSNSSNRPQSLHFDSDNEGSPVPHFSRSNSRPPTSDPSPSVTSQPRSASLANAASPPLIPDGPPTQRPRFLSHQHSSNNITQLPTGSLPVNANVSAGSPSLIRTGPNLEYTGLETQPHQRTTPGTSKPDVLVPNYNYIPLAPDDWQEPVNGIYAPHGESHHGPWTVSDLGNQGTGSGSTSTQSGGGRGSKRYFAQIS